ncbi:protein-disulfide reductase DsbD [Luteimonas sp. MJ250]|uniref:protein-disulfide reductase DsbD n=1 Tax=Luteimonas sp. MJ250 TaxID=3129236 RepID=UPI0031BBB246
MSLLLRVLWAFALFVPAGAQAQDWLSSLAGRAEPEFLDPVDVFTVQASAGEDGGTRLQGEIAPGYYLYRHRLSVTTGAGPLPLTLPKGLEKTDEFFGRTEVYYDAVDMRVDGGGATTATLHWQGCADAGICYPPQTLDIELPHAGESVAVTTPMIATALPATAAGEDQQLASRLANGSLATAIAVFFGLGLLLAFTPCTLPMIPIISSLIVGGEPPPRRALALSAAYVLPMALTYAALGVAAGLAGANLSAALQNPWLLGGFAAVFVMLALSMFGAFELQLPAWVRHRLERAGRGRQGGTLAGAAALGFLSALLVGPCMTAPLAGALLYIGQSGSAVTGGLALFALGLGMGVPLLLIAVFGARILPRPGAWMDRVKAVFGYGLLALAISMLARVLSPAIELALWGVWLLAVAVGLVAMVAPAGSSPVRRWLPRYLAVVSSVWALALMVGGASGASDPWRPLAGFGAAGAAPVAAAPAVEYVQAKTVDDVADRIAEAGTRGQWTLVDFYADWCVSCHVIERDVFGDPRVAEVLAGMQVLRPDVTANDAEDQALQRAWQVAGPPTLLLVGPDGEERRAERTIGELGADAFLQRLQRVMDGAG